MTWSEGLGQSGPGGSGSGIKRRRDATFWVAIVCSAVVALVAGFTVWLNVQTSKPLQELNWQPFYGALFNLSAEPMMHYTGSLPGDAETWDMDVTSGGEQMGSFTVDGQQISVMTVGGKTYIKPPASLLADLPSGDSASSFKGKWITGDDELTSLLPQGLATPLSLTSTLWTALESTTDYPVVGGATEKVDGVAAVRVSTSDGVLYVAADKPYRVLRLALPSAGSTESPTRSASPSVSGSTQASLRLDIGGRADNTVSGRLRSRGHIVQAADGAAGLGQTDVVPMTSADMDQAYSGLIGQTKTLNSALNVGINFDFNQTGNLSCSDTNCTVTENVVTSTQSSQSAKLSGDVTATMTATVTVDGEPGGGCGQTTSLPINGSGTMTCDDPGVAAEVAQIKAQEQETADAEQTTVNFTINFLASVEIEALADVQAEVDQDVQAEQDEQNAADDAAQPDAPCTLNSFAAGTDVLLADGTMEPIQDIGIGDEVENSAPGGADIQQHPVTAVHVTKTDRDFVALTVDGPRGGGRIVSTAAHLYYDATKAAWTAAANLKPGDHLQTPDGAVATVRAAHRYSAAMTTYNLTVDDVHTYYVAAGPTPVLVHNCTEPATPSKRGTAGATKAPPTLQVSKPTGDWSDAERIAQMEQQVPATAVASRTSATSTRTYVGVMDLDTGEYAIASSGGQPGCDAFCAEGNAYNALGSPTNYYITQAYTVTKGEDGQLTAVPKDVCPGCQEDYPPDVFGPDVKMHPSGKYGGG